MAISPHTTISTATWPTAPAPPSSALPGRSPARLPAPVGTLACWSRHRLRAPRSTVTFCLVLRHQRPHPKTRARSLPGQLSSLFLFSFQPNGAFLQHTLSNGLAQILAPLSGTKSTRPASHLPPVPGLRDQFGQVATGSLRAAQATPSRCLPRHSPICARLSCRRHSPQAKNPQNLSMVRANLESERGAPEGRGHWAGASGTRGERAGRNLSGAGVRLGNEGAWEVGCSFYSRAERVT